MLILKLNVLIGAFLHLVNTDNNKLIQKQDILWPSPYHH